MLITVLGNCQADCVARAIRTATAADPSITVQYVAAYTEADEHDVSVLRSADIVVQQLTDSQQKTDLQSENVPGRHIAFPLLEAGFLYPFSTIAHPLNDQSRREYLPAGVFQPQMSDTRLIRLMKDHPDETAESIADRYLDLDYGELLDLDALLDISRTKAQRLGARSGIDLWPQIESMFRYEPLFWTQLHPSETLLRPIYRHVLEQLDIGLTGAGIDAAVDAGTGLAWGHLPIHPSIARHHGIKWVTPRTQYRLSHGGRVTAHDYATMFAQFDYDDALLAAIYEVHRGTDRHGAIEALQAARQRHPRNAEILIHIATAYCHLGDVPQALDAAMAAMDIEPDRADWGTFTRSMMRLMLSPQPAAAAAPAPPPIIAEAPEPVSVTAVPDAPRPPAAKDEAAGRSALIEPIARHRRKTPSLASVAKNGRIDHTLSAAS